MTANYFQGASDLLGGISDLFSGGVSASADNQAAQTYAQAAQYSLLETGIKQVQASRQLYQLTGSNAAAASANGVEVTGSAADVIRSNAQQGALNKAMIGLQGQVDYNSYMAQSQAAAAQAKASQGGGILGMIGGVIGGIASIFSDDNLKEDIVLQRRRPDGIGIYHFRYIGSAQVFEGVLASEVEKIVPAAIWANDAGIRMVDYDRLGIPFRKAA